MAFHLCALALSLTDEGVVPVPEAKPEQLFEDKDQAVGGPAQNYCETFHLGHDLLKRSI